MIRILLVDDHPIVRHGIRTLLTDRIRDAFIAEAGDAHTALRQIEHADWDVVLLDISLPGPNGLDLLKYLRREYPEVPVLVVSMHPASQFARRALGAGALGYLTKDSPPEEFVTAIEHARSGRRYIGTEPSRDLLRWKADAPALPHESLSDREYQVLRLLGAGRSVSEIARALDLSVKTVSTYRARVLEKLGMRGTAELMRYAIENSLLE
jgi:two-component system, NarL family, invasion response regulator UvrY